MLTDDERKTINHAADVLGPSLRDLATRLRAIAAPRVATVGERPRPQCPTHGDTVNCYCTTGALHCHDCGHTPPFCTTCDEYHDAATGCASARGPIGEG